MRAARDGSAGIYLIAAGVFHVDQLDDAREAVRTLAPRPGAKFHWRDESERRREEAVGVVAGLEALHYVVVGSPLDNSRQERCRRQCLGGLLYELSAAGVDQVWMESRRPKQNNNDVQAVNGFRLQGQVRADLRVDHALPTGTTGEPLLWVPDIVAGAINGGRSGYRAALDSVLSEITIGLT